MAMFASLLLLVAVLLSGKAEVHEVCLRTLERREGTVWRIGSINVGKPDWRAVDEWPQTSGRFALAAPFDKPLRPTPGQYGREAFPGDSGHDWALSYHAMPFALFVEIPNKRALSPFAQDVLDTRLIAAAVLDPAIPGDFECLRRLDAVLEAGRGEPGSIEERRRRRKGVPTPGEAAAGVFIKAFLGALELEDPVPVVREVLCNLASS
ncbi:hypothetical protein HZA57_07725 [Candidatus Poribacteria bacterium]|nr:hypothetical protein [Candidatus Poribacteria bacterium]